MLNLNALIFPFGLNKLHYADLFCRAKYFGDVEIDKITEKVDIFLSSKDGLLEAVHDYELRDDIYEFAFDEEYRMLSYFFSRDCGKLVCNRSDFEKLVQPYSLQRNGLTYFRMSYRQYKFVILSMLKKLNKNFLIDEMKSLPENSLIIDLKTKDEINMVKNKLYVFLVDKEKQELAKKGFRLNNVDDEIQNMAINAFDELKNNQFEDFDLAVSNIFYIKDHHNQEHECVFIDINASDDDIVQGIQALK